MSDKLRSSSVRSTVISFVRLAIGTCRAVVPGEQHLAGAPVLDEVGARVHAGPGGEGRRDEQEDGREGEQPELHGGEIYPRLRASRGR